MIRLLFLAAIICIGCKMITGRWPWAFLRPKQARQQAIFNARKLLGVHNTATREEIVDAHRRIIALVHPDRGGTNAQTQEVNAARDLLLDAMPGYAEE